MAEKEELQYISLQEATKYCSYSQEYLSLLARHGKLRATKIGRNWVTTREWVEEYVGEVKAGNNKNNQKEKLVSQTQTEGLASEFSVKEFEEISQQDQREDFDYVEGSFFRGTPKVRFLERIPSVISVALFFVLLVTGIAAGKENFQNVFADVKSYAMAINQNIDPIRNAVSRGIENIGLTISHGVEKGISQGFDGAEYGAEILGDSLANRVKKFTFNISQGTQEISQIE